MPKKRPWYKRALRRIGGVPKNRDWTLGGDFKRTLQRPRKIVTGINKLDQLLGEHFIDLIKMIIGTALSLYAMFYIIGRDQIGFGFIAWGIFVVIFFCVFGVLEIGKEQLKRESGG